MPPRLSQARRSKRRGHPAASQLRWHIGRKPKKMKARRVRKRNGGGRRGFTVWDDVVCNVTMP